MLPYKAALILASKQHSV